MKRPNRDGLRAVLHSKMIGLQLAAVVVYVAACLLGGGNVAVMLGWTVVALVIAAFTAIQVYGVVVSDAEWARELLARDVAAEVFDRENDIIRASRERPEYLETFRHTPDAQAILDRRDAELRAHAEVARAARRARLEAAGRLPA